jgi:hypothetical protein
MSQQFLTELHKQKENAISFDTDYLMQFVKRRQINLEPNSICTYLVYFSAAKFEVAYNFFPILLHSYF